MNDSIDMKEPESLDDFELVIDYLTKDLDPERVAVVERRLKEDPAFLRMAAPMLLAWSIPKHKLRDPRPAGELERHWDEFTKRAGFVHQKRKRRLRLLIVLAALTLVAGPVIYSAIQRVRQNREHERLYPIVETTNGVAHFANGITLELAPGTTLRRVLKDTVADVTRVQLVGSMRASIRRPKATGPVPTYKPLIIETTAGVITCGNGDLRVSAHGDTTNVVLLRRTRAEQPLDFFDQFPDVAVVWRPFEPTRQVVLQEGDSAEVRSGFPITKIVGKKQK